MLGRPVKTFCHYCITCLVVYTAMTCQTYAADDNSHVNRQQLRVAVASNFLPTLKRLAPIFERTNNSNIQIISGSSGSLFQQINYGAPFDVFISADVKRPQQLIKNGLAINEQTKTYAYGTISFWSANWENTGSPLSLSLLLDSIKHTNKRIAIANPNIAPYGAAAKQFFQKNNLWRLVNNRLVTGVNINQTFQQLQTKAVPVGIVATSQLAVNNLTGINLSSHYYDPIEQQVTVLSRSNKQTLAASFIQFLLSASSQNVIAMHGYQPALAATDQKKVMKNG